ncbi:hypothetical protein [Acidilobus sp.]|uniref:hypothetical protein n=1 Tax=Acidilobus sp. TaxID=1872109 RepID=UPI003D01DAA9
MRLLLLIVLLAAAGGLDIAAHATLGHGLLLVHLLRVVHVIHAAGRAGPRGPVTSSGPSNLLISRTLTGIAVPP